ncbi:MAG TPA: FadR/GntR family transcriptional regulator [Gaiellaceae bacterium]|nr:FadR/GntR family transcriptional regulator [Gaiellaceae bacterium]
MEKTASPTDHALLTRQGKGSRRPGRLASVIVEELANEIIGGTLAAGDVLPTEPALCEEFGFSRTVIREALKLLEERGLVRVEQGRGTTVQPRDAWNLLDPVVLRIALAYDDDLSLLDNLIAVRRVMEREMARAATPRLTPAELAALADSVDRMEAAFDDYDHFRACDNEFHAIVMKASGNEVGLTIVRAIHRHGGVTPPLSSGASRAALARTVAAHRAIHDALAERDGELAGELISEHIASAWAERKKRRPARRAATAAR